MIILAVNNLDSLNKDANGTIGFKNQDPTISACKKHTSLQEKYTKRSKIESPTSAGR